MPHVGVTCNRSTNVSNSRSTAVLFHQPYKRPKICKFITVSRNKDLAGFDGTLNRNCDIASN